MKIRRQSIGIALAVIILFTSSLAAAQTAPADTAGDYTVIGPAKQPARIESNLGLWMTVSENMVTLQAVFDYTLRNSGITTLAIPVPEGYRVSDVKGDKIKLAKVESGILRIIFKEAMKDRYRLEVILDKPREQAGGEEPIPAVSTIDAASESGWIAVAVAPGMEVEAKGLAALKAVDPAKLPASMIGGSPVLLAFRFERLPFAGKLSIVSRERLSSLNASIDTINIVTVLTAEGRSITRVIYELRNNLKQNLELVLPPGAKVWSAFVDDQPVEVATDGKDRVYIPLIGARNSRRNTITVELSYYLGLAKLDKSGEIKTLFPKADLPASELMASIYLPFKFEYGDFKGTMEKLEDGIEAMPAGEKKTSWLPLPGEGARPVVQNSDFANIRQQAMEVEIADQVRSGKIQSMIARADIADGSAAGDHAWLDTSPKDRESFSGLLPVKFSVPLRGSVYRFTKLVVVDEAPEMSFTYRKLRAPIPWNQVWWAAKIAVVVLVVLALILIIYRLWKRPRGQSEKPAPSTPAEPAVPSLSSEVPAVSGV